MTQLTALLSPGAECDHLSFGQHYRYVGRTGEYRGTMIPSEAPLLHNQVKLVDPVDRQAHGAPGRGFPILSICTGVEHIYTKGTVGCRLWKLRGAIT